MPRISEHVGIERKPKLGGGGPGKIPHRHGYGGGDDGDHGESDDFISPKDRLRRYRIGMTAAIIAFSTFFIGMAVSYLLRLDTTHWDPDLRHSVRDSHVLALPYPRLFLNSFILLLSSLTLELARRGLLAKSEFAIMGIAPPRFKTELPWLGITVFLGFAFLVGQIMVWNILRNQGVYFNSSIRSGFFYMLTGAHAVHLAGGLLVLLWASITNSMRKRFESRQIAVEVTAWYWHFMGALWILIFVLLHFSKG
ncbi:MAG TPA: cytochrome c oxidase subunit 3 [Candidatus Angelobacter sp.]|jgi:cytochrome c oxidase subunit 3|nr:cytochrome c oxidase subunit 3 [Candidatus Angelobacter sp.]